MEHYTGAFSKYATFSGRATRKEYWMFILINILVVMVLSLLFKNVEELSFIPSIYCLAVLLPTLALMSRRLHDVGKSAWWILIQVIPLIGSVILNCFFVLDSQTGTNAYGSNPKGDQYVAQSAKGYVALVITLGTMVAIAVVVMISLFFVVLSSFGGGYGNQIDSKVQNRIEEILQKQTVTDDRVAN